MRTVAAVLWLLVAVLTGGCAVLDAANTNGYGAVAYAASTQDWRIRWQVIDPQRARQRVIEDCGVADCRVVLAFGPGQCGTLALNSTGFAVGVGATAAEAEATALNDCGRQGSNCRVAAAECNR